MALLVLSFIVLLSACQGQEGPEAETAAASDDLTIITSFYPVYIATVNVVQDVPGVQVRNMTPPITGCLHEYQLRPDDLKNLSQAQIFVINGAGMEDFLDKVVQQLPDLKVVDSSMDIPLLGESETEAGNPHLWVSVANAIRQVENIGSQLAALDPAHAAQYEANATAYVERLEALRSEMHAALEQVETRDIITFHEAFPYFAQEFNLNIAAVIEREPGSEPSAAELADTIEIVRQSQIKALFTEPQYSDKAADIIARETGARIFVLDPAVTGPNEPDAYLKIMEANLNTLLTALKTP